MFVKNVRVWPMLVVAAVITMVFAVFAPATSSANDTFSISVYHGINGNSLGASKALPVAATVEKDGQVLAVLNLEFKDKIETDLPAGTYKITVVSEELGPVPSMTVGPVDIPAGADVSLHAKLSGGKTPIIKAKIK